MTVGSMGWAPNKLISIWVQTRNCTGRKPSLVAQLVKNRLQCRRPQFSSWVSKIRWRRDRLPTPVFLDFPGGSAGKESTCNVGDLGLIPGLCRSPGEENSYPLQYSDLKNSMGSQGQTWLSNFHCLHRTPVIFMVWGAENSNFSKLQQIFWINFCFPLSFFSVIVPPVD